MAPAVFSDCTAPFSANVHVCTHMQLLELKSVQAISTAQKHIFEAAKQRSGRVLHEVVSTMFVHKIRGPLHGPRGKKGSPKNAVCETQYRVC
jgi:hypothetical protein